MWSLCEPWLWLAGDVTSRRHFAGHVTAGALLIDREQRYLAIHHKQLQIWLCPGGHLEPGETDPAQSALRELIEETGISPRRHRPRSTLARHAHRYRLSPDPREREKGRARSFTLGVSLCLHARPGCTGTYPRFDGSNRLRLASPRKPRPQGARAAFVPVNPSVAGGSLAPIDMMNDLYTGPDGGMNSNSPSPCFPLPTGEGTVLHTPGAIQASPAMPRQHPLVGHGRIGVLLLNLGTPDATGYWPMRRYLKEFLSDGRVIEVNRVVWWLVLNLIVLTTRPSKSGEAYKLIWNKERDESPLRTITRARRKRSRAASRRTRASRWTGPCATAIPASSHASKRCGGQAATASSCFRSKQPDGAAANALI